MNIHRSRIPEFTRKTRRLDKIRRTNLNSEALDAAKSFLEGEMDTPLLLFIGTLGVGKTTLSYAIAWEFLEDALTVDYWQAEELLNELQANLESGKDFGRIWTRLRDVDLVILDDMGAHNETKWRTSQLDALVDFRYREKAPMIMTANRVDFDASERITDRIREGRTAMIYDKSWRGGQALP